jgi:hypothetical protein
MLATNTAIAAIQMTLPMVGIGLPPFSLALPEATGYF